MPRVLLSGASGLIGSALTPFLESRGVEVVALVRHAAQRANQVAWEPMQTVPPSLVSGFDAVIHLSGENIAGRWTAAKKRRIYDSRVVSTRNLSRALASAEQKPAIFLCASAIGYYGNRGDELLTEESIAGRGFFADLGREWELATAPAADAGMRTVNMRIGIVLSRNGGALKEMLLPFRVGLGGKLGGGRQWSSWIHISDFVAAVGHLLRGTIAGVNPPCGQLNGPVNMVSPNPVSNAEFTRTMARVLHRPAILRVPKFVLRLAFGELAGEGLLSSARVQPTKLLASGFQFQFPELAGALTNLLT